MINAIHPAPSPTSGTGNWVRATAPTIATPTFTGQAKFDVGTAAAPSVSGPAGTSGLYVTATPTVGIAVGGVSKMLIDAALMSMPISISPVADLTYSIGSTTVRYNDLYCRNLRSGTGINLALSGPAIQIYSLSSEKIRITDAGVRIQIGVNADPSYLLHLAGSGSANGFTHEASTGNSGFGSAPNSTIRAYFVAAVGHRCVYAESDNGISVSAIQSVTVTTANPAAQVYRASLTGGQDATGPVLLVEDATSATGNLLRCRKQGTDRIIGTPAGKGLFLAGIGVGNSAAATTPGNVVRKAEVFDFAGTSLGYVAILDAIT